MTTPTNIDDDANGTKMSFLGGELPVYTIGHSNRPLEVFVEVLHSVGIKALVDIRTVPKSRANPWFWGDNLRVELPLAGVQYHRFDYLGGLRGKSKTVPPEVNAFWQNQSFHNYADWTQGPEFLIGFSELLTLSREVSTVIMCAEVLWWRCHRRIVADYLISAGRTVFHVFDANHVDPASMTTSAIVVGDHIQYPKGA